MTLSGCPERALRMPADAPVGERGAQRAVGELRRPHAGD